MRLQGKVVLVTGSTTGVGEGIARMCLEEGASVMFHGLEKDLAIQLKTEYGSQCDYRILDLSDENSWTSLVDDTVKQFGAIHCLVNNAASTKRCTLENLTPTVMRDMLNVNLLAPIFLTQAAIKHFKQQNIHGSVLNIGSINAYCGEKVLVPYAISKAALMGFTVTAADAPENWEHVRVNQLNLDWVATQNEIHLKIAEGAEEDWFEHVPKHLAPSGKLLTPRDVAELAIIYLTASSKLNGMIVPVGQVPMTVRLNGGQTFFASTQQKKSDTVISDNKEESNKLTFS